MGVKIREAEPEDAAGIAEVHTRSWQTSYRGMLPDDLLDNLSVERRAAFWRQVLEDSLENIVFVAERDGVVVGFVSGGPYRADENLAGGEPVYDCELYAIYLLEDHKRAGIGAALFKKLAAYCWDSGSRSMVLWVLRENPPALRFYEKMGGRVVGEKSEVFGGTTVVETAYAFELGLSK